MRKTGAIFLAFLLAMAMSLPVLAAEGNTVQPLYNNISSLIAGLEINKSTGNARLDGSVDAYYLVPVEVLVQLQVYKNGQWKTLMSWSDSGTGYASAGGSYTVDSGYNYRAKVTGYICNDLGIPIESDVAIQEAYYPAT